MGLEAAFQARNDIAELDRLNAFLEGFWAQNSLPEEFLMEFTLVLEEVFVNVVHYGFPGGGEHEILVGLRLHDGIVTLTVEDPGREFDPLQAPEADVEADISQRPIGGLGIHLVRKLMDHVEYTRVDGRNRLTMRKNVGT